MGNNDFKIMLGIMIDKSSLSEAEKNLAKEKINIDARLNVEDFTKSKQEISKQIELLGKEIQKILGNSISDKQANTWATQFYNQMVSGAKKATKEQELLAKAITKSREASEKARQAEEKRQQSIQNKALEEEYNIRQKIAKQASDIQISIGDNGDITTQIQTITDNFTKLNLSSDEVTQKMSSVSTEFSQLKTVMSSGDNNAIVNQFDKLQTALGETKNDLTMLRSEYSLLATTQQRLNKANDIEAWNQKNTRATKEVRTANESYIASLRDLNSQMTKIQFNEIVTGFKSTENSMRGIGKLGASIKDQFKQAAQSFTQWISVSAGIMALIYQLRKIPSTVKDLNDTITELTMATGASKTQIQSYIESYSDLGDKLSATVIDITESGTEWLKQGKDIAETETLITDAVVLSKIANLSTADSTKYLTSAMKGYNVAVEDTLGVVDKLSAVDLISATDVGGLAEGMSEVSNNANLAGISMDKLLGYLATIGEVTQSSMSEVGTSLNAIFSRMGNIKLSRLTDYETGEDLSDVETVLSGLDIKLRESNDTFRNFGEVLDEVGTNWGNYSDTQQRAIAKAFAG